MYYSYKCIIAKLLHVQIPTEFHNLYIIIECKTEGNTKFYKSTFTLLSLKIWGLELF